MLVIRGFRTQSKLKGKACNKFKAVTRVLALTRRDESTESPLRALARTRSCPGVLCMSMSSCRTAEKSHSSLAQAANTESMVLPVEKAYIAAELSVLTNTRPAIKRQGESFDGNNYINRLKL